MFINKQTKRNLVVVLMALAVVAGPGGVCTTDSYGDTIFVKVGGSGGGTSWGDAYGVLQDALDDAVSGDEIWVAAGTYYPTYDYGLGIGDRGKHFRMINGVAIYGGFAGTETALAQRDVANNVTILSGDIGTVSDNSDNCYHVFFHPRAYLDRTAILDGFTITAGNADGSDSHNDGGGMYNIYGSPAVNGCTFTGNSADDDGGGMFNSRSSPIVMDCTFTGNSAYYGGGMSNQVNGPVVLGCTFSGNSAYDGGGMHNEYSNPRVINCIFWGNTASSNGNEFYNHNSSTPEISYCDIAGCLDGGSWDSSLGADGGGNIDADPMFVDADGADNTPGTEDDNLRLQAVSPCIDAGDNTAVTDITDLDGQPRIMDGDDNGTATVDMGAYEYYGSAYEPTVFYVDADATGGDNNGASWEDAFTFLQDALDAAIMRDEIWVAAGTYKPDQYNATPGGTGYRWEAFQMKYGVGIYGGFAGTETALAQRDVSNNETILSGDIGTVSDNSDNCYHVFFHPSGLNLDSTAVLDGFTITGGNANYAGSGGGMCNSASSPTITNCTFTGNFADSGGGMSNYNGSDATVTDCTFSGNSAGKGGGMYNSGSSPTITNCTFSGNSANDVGGGMCNWFSSEPTVANCTFSGNSAWSGGGMSNSESDATVTNCILWGNTTIGGSGSEISITYSSTMNVSYCDVQGGEAGIYFYASSSVTWGTGNIDEDPVFVDADGADGIYGTEDDNLRLQGDSPCIDAGDNSVVTEATDRDGRERIMDGDDNGTATVDMGAYEFQIVYSDIVYVDQDATSGYQNGTSWDDAYLTFQGALDDAVVSGKDIWVAAGTYYPTYDYGLGIGDRGRHFRMINGVTIYGGFDGTETALAQRDVSNNETILSGDIGTVLDNSDNCHHVFYHPLGVNLDTTAVLDGFIITAGNADGSSPHNYGGGMYNRESSPTVTGCTFSGNSANITGGGMSNYNTSSPTVTGCTFSGNSAGAGSGMSNYDTSSPAVSNCIFSGNTATSTGGGMWNNYATPSVINCTFSNNSAGYGGGMYNNLSSPTLTNCILWGNTASLEDNEIYNSDPTSIPEISYCDITGCGGSGASWDNDLGTDAGGNIDAAPLFVDAGSGDLRLLAGSPCIDAGDNTAVPSGVTTDLDGLPRIVNVVVDMGAYEYQDIVVICVDTNATGANNGTNWEDAFNYLQDGLAAANYGDTILVAEGTYKPDRGGGQTVWNRAATFQLINGVAIYGGFPSGGGDWSERDPSAYETILSGNIGWMWPTDNSYHVVTGSGTNNTAVLDGFTITAGYADGSYPDNMGGGMYNHTGSSPTIINCRLRGNAAYSAGAMFNLVSSPTLINCIIAGNSVQSAGGGMHSVNSNLTLVNCIFSGNQATHGGAMYNQGGTPTLTNCSLSGNTAGGEGGGIYNNNSDPILTNSILWGNSASGVYDEVGQIANNPGSTPVINYCCVQGWTGGLGGTGNIGDDPLFVDPPDNLRLLADSNCIDTGNNSAVPSGVTTDLDGHPRIVDGDCNDTVIVDMGAYEFNWAYIGDFDGDYDVDFADFAIFALACLTEPGDAQWNPDCDISIPADNYIDWSDLDVFSDNWLARARFSPIPNLLFSEYVEGSRSNQAVEIYNAGDVEVYLVNCYVRIYNNGSSSPVNTVHLNAVTLLPGEVFVLGHPGISVPSFCDQLSEYLSFNGNDAIELVYKRATHDVIGQIGFDPGPLGWGSRDTTTTDHTLRRKCSVSTGDRDGYDSFYPAVEWEAFPLDTFDGLGSHCQ